MSSWRASKGQNGLHKNKHTEQHKCTFINVNERWATTKNQYVCYEWVQGIENRKWCKQYIFCLWLTALNDTFLLYFIISVVTLNNLLSLISHSQERDFAGYFIFSQGLITCVCVHYSARHEKQPNSNKNARFWLVESTLSLKSGVIYIEPYFRFIKLKTLDTLDWQQSNLYNWKQ